MLRISRVARVARLLREVKWACHWFAAHTQSYELNCYSHKKMSCPIYSAVKVHHDFHSAF